MAHYDEITVATFSEYPTAYILRSLGVDVPFRDGQLEGVMCSPFREDRTPSFSIHRRNGIWFCKDFATEETFNNVSLIKKLCNCDTAEAYDRIAAIIGRAPVENKDTYKKPAYTEAQNAQQSAITVTGKDSVRYSVLKDYATGRRHIASEILQKYCFQITYQTEGRNGRSFAIGFPNRSDGWVLRQADTVDANGVMRKRTVRCTNSDITIISKDGVFQKEKGFSSSESVCIFEGFFDYLAWQTARFETGNGSTPSCDIIVLNSVVNLDKAMECILKHDNVYGFFDMDDAGRRKSDELQHALESATDRQRLYDDSTPKFCCNGEKDISDWLSKKKETQALSPKHSSKTPSNSHKR